MSKSSPKFALALLVTGVTACEQQPLDVVFESAIAAESSAAATQGALLGQVRAATAPYHRVEAAVADGYTPQTLCIFNTPGGRGIIYANFALIDGVVDPTKPELLVYEPTRNGELRLVAAALMVPSAAWDPTHSSPPVLGDQEFVDRRTPPFGAGFANYVLFTWVWRHNPSGMYELYNPQVSCEFADGAEMR